MNLKKAVVLSGFIIVMMAITQIVFAEEAAVAPADPAAITSDQQSTSPKETDMQWAWGEVTNIDNQAKTVTLKYLDYETDQEKDLVLTVDEKTTFENIKGFDELKLKDTLSIDYIAGINNKNIVKNISFEKSDVVPSPLASAGENSEPVAPPLSTDQSVVDAAAAQPAVPVPPAVQSVIPVDSSITANAALVPAAPAQKSASVPVAPEPPAVQDQAQ